MQLIPSCTGVASSRLGATTDGSAGVERVGGASRGLNWRHCSCYCKPLTPTLSTWKFLRRKQHSNLVASATQANPQPAHNHTHAGRGHLNILPPRGVQTADWGACAYFPALTRVWSQAGTCKLLGAFDKDYLEIAAGSA
eukprot:758436-Rhodomonas_salina.5